MRNMSFSMTTGAFTRKEKRVTRRMGWVDLQPGEHLMGVQKCRGLKRGEKVRRIHAIVVINVRREPVSAIALEEDGTAKEGFPDMTAEEFIDMFCRHNKCGPDEIITRIEFDYED